MKQQLVFMDDDPSILKKMEKMEKTLEEIRKELQTLKNVTGDGYPELMTLEQAADMLDRSVRSLYELRIEDEMPCFPLGNRVYIFKKDLLAWLEKFKKKK